MRAISSVLSLSLLVPFTFLQAQVQPPINAGDRVRVSAPDLGADRLVATLDRLDGDMLTVSLTGDLTMQFPLAAVTQLDVYIGQHGHPWRGAAIGLLLGAGAVVAYEKACTGRNCRVDTFIAAATMIPMTSALLGALVGSLIKTDKWQRVALDRLRVSLATQPNGGLGVGLAVVF